jgi:hypothetical protein
MSSVYEMFDRTSLVEALDQDLLTGKSAVVIGAPKIGKTHLLEHISSRPTSNQGSLFCKIGIYSLVSSLREGEALSDHVFLRLFLRKLQPQVGELFDCQNARKEEDDWDGAIKKAEQQVELLKQLPADARIAEMLEQQRITINALKAQLAELDKLGKVAGKMKGLIERTEPIRVYEVSDIFLDLNKRVILIIDEFDRILRERGFTTNLYSFLRGNDRTIVTIVSSPLRLMDPSLHPDLAKQDRTDLFNHFQPKILEPFTPDEAREYLGWLPDDTLTPDEKEYVQSLGGGSPHFLKIARETFLRYGRPALPAERDEFERKYLSLVFEDAFHYIWERCTSADRSALRQFVQGGELDLSTSLGLIRQGYLVRNPTGCHLFCPLFSDYLKRQTADAPTASASATAPVSDLAAVKPSKKQKSPELVEIEAIPLQHVFPTSLYYADPEHTDFMVFRLKNNTQETLCVQLRWRLDGYSQWSSAPFDVPPGTMDARVKIVLKDSEVRQLIDPVTTQIEYRAALRSGDNEQSLPNKTVTVRLLPVNNFLVARFDEKQNVLLDFTWTIAAWVDKNEPNLPRVVRKAIQLNPAVEQMGKPGEDIRQVTRCRVEALYQVLKELEISYQESRLVFHEEEKDLVQRVRLPGETLNYAMANCLDAAVLFASLLSYCDIDPSILLVPGHAIVGWRNPDGPGREWEFVDVAGIASTSFGDACHIGQERYAEVKDKCSEFAADSDGTLNPKEFAVLVDVHQVLRERGLLPLRTY